MSWTEIKCEYYVGNVCNAPTHLWPEPGTRVRLARDFYAREVGGDTEYKLSAGTTGVVAGYVVEWHDVDVDLGDGRAVWVDVDELRENGD